MPFDIAGARQSYTDDDIKTFFNERLDVDAALSAGYTLDDIASEWDNLVPAEKAAVEPPAPAVQPEPIAAPAPVEPAIPEEPLPEPVFEQPAFETAVQPSPPSTTLAQEAPIQKTPPPEPVEPVFEEPTFEEATKPVAPPATTAIPETPVGVPIGPRRPPRVEDPQAEVEKLLGPKEKNEIKKVKLQMVHGSQFMTAHNITKDMKPSMKERIRELSKRESGILKSFLSGNVGADLDLYLFSSMFSDEEAEKKMLNLKKAFQYATYKDPDKKEGFVKGAVNDAAAMLPAMAKGLSGVLVGSLAAPGIGTGAGASYWFAQGAGQMYGDLREAGVTRENARAIALPAGALYSAIESVQVGRISGVSKAVKKSIQDLAKKEVKNVAAKFAKDRGKDWLRNVSEEVLQEFVTTIAQQTGEQIEGISDKSKAELIQLIAQRGWDTVKQTAAPLALMAVPGAGVGGARLAAQHSQQTKAEASEEAFAKVLEATTPDKAQIQQQEEVIEEVPAQPEAQIAETAPQEIAVEPEVPGEAVTQQLEAPIDAAEQPVAPEAAPEVAIEEKTPEAPEKKVDIPVLKDAIKVKFQREGKTEEESVKLAEEITAQVGSVGHILESAFAAERRGAERDELTGLKNRKWATRNELTQKGKDEKGNEIDLIKDGRQAFVDVDNFGVFNKEHGEAAGDVALKKVASILEKHLGEKTDVIRWGGEEIVPRFKEGVNDKGVIPSLNEAREEIKEATGLTISTGIADTQQEADRQMLAAKKAGKDRIFAGGKEYAIETKPDKEGDKGIRPVSGDPGRARGSETPVTQKGKAKEVKPTPSKAEKVTLTAKEKAAQQKDKKAFEAKKKKVAQAGFVDLSKKPEKVPEKTSGVTNFEAPNETRRDFLRRKLQDSFIRLRRIQETPGVKVDKKTDAYLKQELLHGRTEKKLKDIERDYVVPLRKDIVRSDVDFKGFEDYLYAKHAPERNKYIQSINKEFRTKEEIIDEAGNVIDVRELGEGGSGMTDKEAADILENAKQKGLTKKYERLTKQVKAINKKRIRILREEGLEDPEVLDKWEKYQDYVPLKGINEPEKQRARTGKGLSVTGPESKRALGRRSKASNILSNSLLGLQETIVRAEKNRVGKSFLQLARDNPNPDLWEINPVEKKKMFDKRTGEVVSRVDPFTKFDDDVLIVKEGGKEFAIKIKDEALARAMTNMGADKSGKVVQLLGTFNRYLSAINTTFVPEFVISNFARDIQTATINMSGENSFKTARQVAKDVPKAMKGAWQGIRDKGDSEWKDWYNEYEEAGGKIGFFGLENIEDLQKSLMKEMSLMRPGVKSTSLKMFRAAKDFVMDVNGAVENATRLSVYVNMRKQKYSKEKAASVAKNITVNFNRKGELGTLMNSLYMFSNASIQGNVRMLRAAKSPKVRKILGGIAVGSLALAQMNRMLAGEDDDGENFYDKVPKWVKENNLVIMKPNGKFFKIPLPYGYNIFYSVGQAVDNAVHNPGSVMESASMVAGTVANSFNPLGATSTLLQTLVPSQFRWLADLGLNKNFFGSPIAKEQKFGPKKAKAETYFKSSTQGSRMVAQSLNELSGGSKYKSGLLDVSPDAIDYVLEYLSGGAGRSVIQALEFADKVATNKPIPTRRIPFVRRVAGEVHEFQNTQKFYERYDEIQKVKAEYKDLKALDGAEAVKFKTKHLKTLGLEKMAKKIVSRISSLNKYKAKAKTDKKVKFYEKAIKVQVDRFNKIYNERIK